MWEIGADVKPGVYVADGNDGRCVWFTLDDFTHRPRPGHLITWWKVGPPIVELPQDGIGFYSIRCGDWVLRDVDVPDAPSTEFGAGSYLVGKDVAPGVYATDAGDGVCDWFRTAPFGDTAPDATGGYASVGKQTIRILPTDTGFYSNGCGTWTPYDPTESERVGDGTFGTGTLSVGSEIRPGVYLADAIADRMCRWFTLNDFAGRPSDIVREGYGIVRGIVSISEGIAGFRSFDCGEWKLLENIADGKIGDTFGDGEQIVDIHIAPGIYTSPGPDVGRCSWRRSTGFTGAATESVAVRNPVGRNIAEVTQGDAMFVSFGCGGWEPFRPTTDSPLLETIDKGTWAVNSEIASGTYSAIIPDGSMCFWSRLSAFTGEARDFVITDSMVGQSVATIRPFDVGFYSDGCGTWNLVPEEIDKDATTVQSEFSDGIYVVDRDIAPGTYIASGMDDEVCFWSRLTGFDGDTFNRINVYASRGQAIATIMDGDLGFRSFGCGTWSVGSESAKLRSFTDGTYRVGVDIEPGTYVVADASGATCRWRRLSDFSWTSGTLVESIASGQKIVTIRAEDVGFYSFGCGRWIPFNLQEAEPSEGMPSRFSNGSYLVGIDIEPGTYYAVPRRGGGCHWSRVNDFTGDRADIIASGTSQDRWIVTIEESDVGFVTQGCGTWRNLKIALPIGPYASFDDGVYRIGADIVPGNYVAIVPTQEYIDGEPVPKCKWSIVSDFEHTGTNIIASGIGKGRIEVSLDLELSHQDGVELGFVSRGCGEWRMLSPTSG